MITVYTRDNCAACKGTEALMDKLGIEYTEINIQNPGNERYAQKLVDEGHRRMPVVVTETETWTGTNVEKIRALASEVALKNP